MTREEEIELAYAERDRQNLQAFMEDQDDERSAVNEAENDKHFARLVDIFDNQGAAWVSENYDYVKSRFPSKFVHDHIRVDNYGTKFQRVRLRCDIREARP
ncbi:MAG: hypothetical protein PGN25_07345 [Methylorubrum populi]